MFLGSIKLPFQGKCSLSTLRHINPTQCSVFLSITKIHHPIFPALLEQHWVSPFFLDVAKFITPFGRLSPLDMVVLWKKTFYFLGGVLRGVSLWASMPKCIAPSRKVSFMTWKTTCNKPHLTSIPFVVAHWR